MKNQKILTKILLLALTVVMTVGLFAISSFAEDKQADCDHSGYELVDGKMTVIAAKPYMVGKCGGCEKVVRNPLNSLLTNKSGTDGINDKLLAGEAVTVTANRNVYVDYEAVGDAASPYTVEFDVKFNSVNVDLLVSNGGNRNFFDATDGSGYQRFLRYFAYSDRQGEADIRIGNTADSPFVTTVKAGESYHFKLIVNPKTGQRSVEIECYNLATPDVVVTATGAISSLGSNKDACRFRFNDLENAEIEISNFAFYNNEKVEPKPCYHQNHSLIENKAVVEDGKFYLAGVCTGCLQEVKLEYHNLLAESTASGRVNGEFLKGNAVTVKAATYVGMTEALIGPAAKSYIVEFDVKAKDINSASAGKFFAAEVLTREKPKKSYEYADFLGLYATSGTEAELKIGNSDVVATIKEGESYHLKLTVAPANNAITVECYNIADGTMSKKSATVGAISAGKLSYDFRFGDANFGEFEISGFAFYDEILPDLNHIHTYEYSEDTFVTVEKNTVKFEYICYCDEKCVLGITELVKDNFVDAYEGINEFGEMPTSGEYWIAFGYNVRDAIRVSADIVKLGDTVICNISKSFDAAVTVTYAINVKYVDENVINYTVYMDGVKAVEKNDVSISGDASVLTVGKDGLKDVRVTNLKVVNIGTGDVVTPTFTANDLKPCHHANYGLADIKGKVIVDGKLYTSGTCKGCADEAMLPVNNLMVSSTQADAVNNKFLNGETVKLSGEKRIYSSEAAIGPGADPYTVEFDVKINSIDSSKNNKSMFDATDNTTYQFLLRMFTSSSEEAQLRMGNTDDSPLVTTIKKGHSYHFKLVVEQLGSQVSVVVEGYDLDTKETFRQTGKLAALASGKNTYAFRVMNGAVGEFEFSNLVFYNAAAVVVAHTHTYKWADDVALDVLNGDLTVSYTCYCGEKVGISEVVADKITPAYDAAEETVILSSFETPEKEFWFAGAISAEALPKTTKALFTIGDAALVEIGADGELVVGGEKTGAVLAADGEYHALAVRFDPAAKQYDVYFDGAKIAAAACEIVGGDVKLASKDAGVYNLDRAAFVVIADGGNGKYEVVAHEHIAEIKAYSLDYVNANAFKLNYSCGECGRGVTEQIVKSYYEDVKSYYVDGVNAVKANEKGDNYWIVVDVNVRGRIGTFSGYTPLISDNGVAALLINKNGELALADAKKVSKTLESGNTYNVALKYADGAYYLFVDGKYLGCTTGESFAEGVVSEKDGYDYFGNEKLTNIRYYNPKAISTAITNAPVFVGFADVWSSIPCNHAYHGFVDVTVIFDEQIKEVYTCSKCGERAIRVNDTNLLKENIGNFTVTDYKPINSDEATLGVNGAPYWVRFTAEFEEFASAAALSEGNKANTGVTFFGVSNGSDFGHILRMFAAMDEDGTYIEGAIQLRNSNNVKNPLIATIYKGEVHEFAIGLNPATGVFVVYMDGELVSQGASATMKSGKSSYYFRFLDGKWGTFNISGFEFVTAGGHEHTPIYYKEINGGYNVLAYTATSLTHRYTCYCGEKVVEGIAKVFADSAEGLKTAGVLGADPYWLSSKVKYLADGEATVYAFGSIEPMVAIDGDRYFVVDGVQTEIKASEVDDYDIISVKVIPTTGEYNVYVNGAYIASGMAGFNADESFNILVDENDADIAYSNIKLVKLAAGANGRVENFVADGCTGHSAEDLEAGKLVKTLVLDKDNRVESIAYVCPLGCGYKITQEVAEEKTAISVDKKETFISKGTIKAGETPADGKNYVEPHKVTLGEEVKENGKYWISFTVTLDNMIQELGSLYNNGTGRNLFDFSFTGDFRFFIRTFAVPEGNGYSADKIIIRAENNANAEIIKELSKGDSVTVSLYIDTTGSTSSIDVYADGVYVATKEGKADNNGTLSNVVRFGDANANPYMTISGIDAYRADVGAINLPDDEEIAGSCEHADKTCAEVGRTHECEKCGCEIVALHNYTETLDASGMWTKYACADCGEFFIVFNGECDKAFDTNYRLMEYLTDTYPPQFTFIPKR